MDELGANESKDNIDNPWDDSLLIKAYDDSIRLAREELARRVALSTSKDIDNESMVCKKNLNREVIDDNSANIEYKIGDYVRATYEDGVDYEAKIISIDRSSGTCLLKYIGYENDQEVLLRDLIPSWGKKARRIQFAKAKLGEETLNVDKSCFKASKNASFNLKTIPPPPPMPPMLCATQNSEDAEHLSAMLMSWYMSGYYTGVYQGIQMGKSASKNKK